MKSIWAVLLILLIGYAPAPARADEPMDRDPLMELERDLDYYESHLRTSSRSAQEEFIKSILEKYRGKGVDEIYLLPLKDKLKKTIPHEDWYIGPKLGISAFTGILGLEIQYRHLSFSAGIPGRGGVKYYFSIPRSSWFAGAMYARWSWSDDETADKTLVRKEYITEIGPAFGYRWRWGSGWDLELGLAAIWMKEKTERYNGSRENDSFISAFPCLSFGYSF